jgi:hypothetical protein
VHHTLNRCARPVAAALAVLLSMATVAPPALGAEPAEATPLQASLSASAAAHVAALDAATLAAAQQTAPAVDESQSFLKSRKGVLAAVLFVAGVTFTFVSKSRDRVKSPIRD